MIFHVSIKQKRKDFKNVFPYVVKGVVPCIRAFRRYTAKLRLKSFRNLNIKAKKEK